MGPRLAELHPTGTYGEDEAFLQKHVGPQIAEEKILRHTFNPSESWERPLPPPIIGEPHFGQQIAPSATDVIRCVVLSPEHYAKRRVKFYQSLESSGCSIKQIEWYWAKTTKERVLPCHIDHAEAHPHYHLATRDHVDIVERSLVERDEHLIVFEDDTRFDPDFEEYLSRMWVSLPDDWLGAMLGGSPWTDHAREFVSPASANTHARVQGCEGASARTTPCRTAQACGGPSTISPNGTGWSSIKHSVTCNKTIQGSTAPQSGSSTSTRMWPSSVKMNDQTTGFKPQHNPHKIRALRDGM